MPLYDIKWLIKSINVFPWNFEWYMVKSATEDQEMLYQSLANTVYVKQRVSINFWVILGKICYRDPRNVLSVWRTLFMSSTGFGWYAEEELGVTKTKEDTNLECNEVHARFFFDIKGIVRLEKIVHTGATANSNFYSNVLQRLREDMRQKKKTWILIQWQCTWSRIPQNDIIFDGCTTQSVFACTSHLQTSHCSKNWKWR